MVQELEATEEIDARTIQTGFVRFWDDAGGDKDHSNVKEGGFAWSPDHYEFFRPQTAPDDDDITIGKKGGTKNTFRMIPRGIARGTQGSQEADDYVKKLLFTWAIDLAPQKMADLFGTKLRAYEKPKVTRSGKGRLMTKRRASTYPLPLDTQQTKFLWARLIYDNAEVVIHKDIYSAMYEDHTANSYKIAMNQASNRAMRDLFKELGKKKGLLKVGVGGGKTLGAESAEEIMIAMAGADLSKWNEEETTEEEMMKDMEEIISKMPIRERGSKIDIPPHLEDEIERITNLLEGQGQADLIERIKKGGIEVTEQHGRLAEMYGSGKTGDGRQFIEFYTKKIKEDIVKQYTKSTRKATGKRTVAEQFYTRGVGLGETDVLTWSEPAWGGVAFFSVYIPEKRPLSASDIGVISYFLDDTPSIWRGILRQQGIHRNHHKVANALKNVFSGVITVKGGAVIKTKTLGTTLGHMPGFGKTQMISTRVDATAPKKVAKGLYDLVKKAAEKIGARLTLDEGAAFSKWVKAQHKRGEESAWGIHQRKGRGWRDWIEKTGGKEDPKPKAAVDWTQPIHPRPFLWMSAVGQAPASQETWKQNFGE